MGPLFIVLATIITLLSIAWVMYFIVWAQRKLSRIVFDSDYPILEKLVAFILWIPFSIIKLALDLMTLGSAIYLYRRVHWYHKND